MYKFMDKYRIREHTGTFNVQGLYKVITRSWVFGGKRVWEEWCTLNSWGGRWWVSMAVPIHEPMASYDTLKEAMDAIKMFKRGEIIHEV